MSKRKQIHIRNENSGWKVDGIKKSYDTRSDAVEAGSRIGRSTGNVELIVHRMDGKIGERRTYGKDPFPPKG